MGTQLPPPLPLNPAPPLLPPPNELNELIELTHPLLLYLRWMWSSGSHTLTPDARARSLPSPRLPPLVLSSPTLPLLPPRPPHRLREPPQRRLPPSFLPSTQTASPDH